MNEMVLCLHCYFYFFTGIFEKMLCFVWVKDCCVCICWCVSGCGHMCVLVRARVWVWMCICECMGSRLPSQRFFC